MQYCLFFEMKFRPDYILLVAFSVFVISGTKLHAQKYNKIPNQEVGATIGVANYTGDLSNTGSGFFGEIQPRAFRPAGGILYRNNFSRFASFRSSFTVGQVMGDDRFYDDPERASRNLHFRSNIADINMMLEWNILPFLIGHYKYKFTPYIGAGIGGFMFNPKAELDGRWVALQPLGTEGQGLLEYPDRVKYSKMSFNIPLSFGLKLNLSRYIAIGLEFQYRLTFTDYLDDVSTIYPNTDYYYNNYVRAVADEAAALSYRGTLDNPTGIEGLQRGNPDKKDAFFFTMFTFSYSIGRGAGSCYTFKKNN
jgi:hypothetical protein